MPKCRVQPGSWKLIECSDYGQGDFPLLSAFDPKVRVTVSLLTRRSSSEVGESREGVLSLHVS